MQVFINKCAVTLALILTLSLTLSSAPSLAASIGDVWSATQEGSYNSLPEHVTTRASFFDGWTNLLENAAKRTLSDESDILPHFQKLVHPIGACFKGTWNITESSPYTGYFSKGSSAIIIVRASEAMGNPRQGDWRAFGFAGKVFPTNDPKDPKSYHTANFFTVDDLGGTNAQSFLELGKKNEPAVSFHLGSVLLIPLITTITRAFSSADSNPGIRPLYQIAELGMENPGLARTPHWMMIKADTTRLNSIPADFRDELRLRNYPGERLEFGVYTSEKGDTEWARLGTIELTEEALSDGCDHRLHFNHPRTR